MEFTKNDMNVLKGIAILFMLLLHLFCTKDVNGLYDTFPTIVGIPFVYYLALFGDACVPIYCFASGYGLFMLYSSGKMSMNNNMLRILKLLINFWIVLVLFVGIGFVAEKGDTLPGSAYSFFENFFVMSNSYNGAWWFLQTYIILVLLSPGLMRLVHRYHSIWLLVLVGVIYLISYIQRIKNVIDFSGYPILYDVVQSSVLVGTSLLPFIAGSLFAKEKLYSKVSRLVHKLKYKNAFCTIGIAGLITAHAFYESMIIAPVTAILFVCLFSFMNKSTPVQISFQYFSKHSTNIWLTHMFFYMTIFPELVFYPKYPILIFVWLVILCLVTSHIINLMYYPLIRMLDRKSAAFKERDRIGGLGVGKKKAGV